MGKKVRISARLNPHNYEAVLSIANNLFFDEDKNIGNISQALNWIIESFRLNSNFTKLAFYLLHLDRYKRGVRNKETIDAVKEFQVLLKSIEHLL